MCGFVKASMSLAILRSNSLLLFGPQVKGGRIPQQLELTDGELMALIAPLWEEIGWVLKGKVVRYEFKNSDAVMESI